MNDTIGIELRVIPAPYIAFGVLGGWAPFLLLYGAITTPSSRGDLLFAFFLGVIIFSCLFAAFWFYRVSLSNGVLVEKKFLTASRSVPVSSIERWSYEVAWPNQTGWVWVGNLRPFRRIAIYYRDDDSNEKYFDISLNHFPVKDVRRMLQEISLQRPDIKPLKGFKMTP